MEFFKSVFAEDPDPPSPPRSDPESSSNTPPTEDPETLNHGFQPDSNPTTPSSSSSSMAGGGSWSFGGLIKTFATKSESVIETYRRDLQEFGSGLKKETEVIREVASRAVKDLPTSLEIGASKAQDSLESVGQAIDSIGSVVWKSTSEIIAHGKESLLSADFESDSSDIASNSSNLNAQGVNSGRYSRFDAQLRSIQCDMNTYIEEPEDVDDYSKWKLGFDLEEQREEIASLMRENGSMEGIYSRLVPNTLDHEAFWYRYYYRVHRLKQAEFVRSNLVKRAISIQDEEELSWDVDDDEDEGEASVLASDVARVSLKDDNSSNQIENTFDKESQVGSSMVSDNNGEKKDGIVKSEKPSNEIVSLEERFEENEDESLKKADEKANSEGKAESSKDSDISVVSSQPYPEEEDLGWDEIEDIGSGDEKKVTQNDSPNRVELRKRLSAAEEDEDLSWDIEDDDEPIKS